MGRADQRVRIGERLRIAPEIRDALAAGAPVVALETTIVSHGMPYPRNVETARALEREIRGRGATPATIAVLDGAIRVGLSEGELRRCAERAARPDSRSHLPGVVVVALGRQKAEPLRVAVERRLVNCLLIDAELAEELALRCP